MTWNNRIFRHTTSHSRTGAKITTFAMHEAYYDDAGKPTTWTSSAVSDHRESVDELIEHLSQLLDDACRSKDDVLEYTE